MKKTANDKMRLPLAPFQRFRRRFLGLQAQPSAIPDWGLLPTLLSIRTTARLLHVHPNTLRLWDQRGLLRAVRIGSRRDRRYERTLVRQFWESHVSLTLTSFPIARRARTGKPALRIRLSRRTAPVLGAAVMLLATLITSLYAAVQASAKTAREYALQPSQCEGWEKSANARSIELPPLASPNAFSENNSARFHADSLALHSGIEGTLVTGSLDAVISHTLTCTGFSDAAMKSEARLLSAQLMLSLNVRTAPNSTDTFFVEGSTEGEQWKYIAGFPQREEPSGYAVAKLPFVRSMRDLANLRIRIRAETTFYDARTEVMLDGLRVVITQGEEESAETTSGEALRAGSPFDRAPRVDPGLDRLVAFSQAAFQAGEQPVITVPKQRQKSFLFFRRGVVTWSIDSVTLINAEGKRLTPQYHVRERGAGATIDNQIHIDTHGLQPGKYRLAITMASSSGEQETVEKDFTWGVVALNVTRAVARPDTQQEVSMAVLDDLGHTICDADLQLLVTDPKGKKQRFSTGRGTIETSGVCVDKGVTNKPDYVARFSVELPGIYHLHLEADTKAGRRTLDDSFTVEPAASFDVVRVDFPTRIYPRAEYPVRFAVTPLRDYTGLVRERAANNIQIDTFQPEATVRQNPDDPNEKFIEWVVQWKAGDTYFLSYSFDAPDISPELFLLGEFSVGGSFTDAPLFTENRQWQLASDSIGTASGARLASVGFELNSVTNAVELNTSTGTPAIDTSPKHGGDYSLEINSSAATEAMAIRYASANSSSDLYFRAYIYMTTEPDAATRFMALADSIPSQQASIRWDGTNNTLELWDEEDGAQVGSDSPAISLSTWYRVEMRYDFGTAATGDTVAEARLDGVSFASATNLNHENGVLDLGIGFATTAATGDVNFDDIAVNDDTGGNDQNWPGEGYIVNMQAAADAANTCDGLITVDWYTYLDEVTPDDATSTILCDALGDVVSVGTETTSSAGIPANAQIEVVQAGARYRRATAAPAAHTLRVNIPTANAQEAGSSQSDSVTAYNTNKGAAPRNYTLTVFDQTASTDGDPITTADLDSGITLELTIDDDAPDTRVSTLWLLVEYVPAAGGRLYSSGFELQDVSTSGMEWATVAGTLAVSTSVKHGGAASMQVGSLGSGTEESVEQDFAAANASGPYFGRVYLRVDTLPSAENRIIEFQNAANTAVLYVTVSSTGTLAIYDNVGQVGSASRAITTAVWYRVEFKLDASGAGATDTIEGKINGETFATSATRTLTSGVTSLVVGGNLNAEAQTTGTWYMDDVAVNQNTGTTQNSYPGAGFITHLRPNATGDNGAWTNANTEIDEVTPDDATTVISSSTANDIEDVNLDSSSTGGIGASDTINLVSVGFRFRLDVGTTQSDVAVRIKEDASNPAIEGPRWPVTSTTWTTNSTTSPKLPSLTLYDQPLQSAAWTAAVLDTTQVGVRLTTDGSANNIQVTAEWLLVDYTTKVAISGNAYSDEGSTAIDGSGVNKTVNLLINGFGTDTDEITASSGAWDVQNLTLISGDIVTVYLDGESQQGAHIYVSDATAKSDVHIFQNRIIVRADTGSISNANIGTGDNADADVPVSVSSSNLTVDSGFELHVYTGDTYAPGGTVTTNATGGLFHLDDSAAVTLANATNSIGTDVTIDTGATLTVNADTVVAGGDITATGTLTTSSGTPTITMRGTGNISGAGTKTIYNLTIGDGTTAATTLTGAAIVNNDVSVATGSTFNVNADISAAGGDFTNTGTGVINTTSGTPTVTVSGTGSIGGVSGSTTFYNLTLSGTPTFGSNFVVNNNLTLPSSVTAGTTTVTMAGTSGTLVGGGATIYALTIDPSSAGTTTLSTSDLTVSNALTLAASDALTLSSGRTITLSGNSGTTLSLSGTLNGPGRLTYQNAATTFPTGGTLALTLIVRFDTVNGAMTIPARTDYGAIEAYGGSANARTVTLGTAGSQTITTSSYFYVIADAVSPNHVTIQGATWDPTLNIGGDFDFTGTGAADEIVTAPDAAATWTVSGNFDLTSGTWTASAETLVMNGTSKTLTTDSEILFNVTLSGTITLANATHTISGNFSMAGGTVTAGSSTVSMSGSGKTLTGGSNTLNNLTLDGNGTTTLSTSGLTVSDTLNVTASDTLTISSGLTLTLSKNTATSLTLSGTINGPGRLTYQNSATTFPTGGTLAATLITRFDTVNGNMVVPARTDYGVIEAFGGSANARTVTLGTAGSQTITTSSHLYVIADAASPNHVTLQGATWDPTLNVGGDLDFTGTGAANEIVTAPDAAATWTVSGNVTFTDGTWTASAETLVMNGSSKTLTSAGNTLFNVTLSGSLTLANATHAISGDFSMAGGTITAGTSTVTMTGTKNLTGGSQTLNNLTIDGTNNTVTLTTSDVTVSGLLTIGGSADSNNDTLSISAGRTLTLSGNSGTTLTLVGSGTDSISGSGTLTYQNSATTFPTAGSLGSSLIVRFDTVNGNMNVPARTDYGAIEAYGGSANARTVTLGTAGSQTITTSSYFYVIAAAASPNDVTIQGATWDPTLNVGGDLDFTGSGTASEVITAPDAAATWTVSGNVDLTSGTYTTSAETLVMNGTSKTLTSASQTLFNVTLSGTITLANATHTISGNFSMASGTITAGTSTVSMTGSGKTLTGGSNTLNNLTLDGNGTTTLSTSGLTVSDTLNVTASDTFTISSGLTITLSKNTATSLTLSGTINGPGRLTYQNSATDFPTGGTLAATLIVRFDTVNGAMNIPARTDYGAIEAYGGSANARTVTLGTAGSQTITTSSYFYVIADAASPNHVTIQGATWDPTLNVGGDLDFTGTGAANEIVTAPDAAATWTVTGNVDLTSGSWTASAETLLMNGTANLVGGGQTIANLTVNGTNTTVTATTSDITVSGTITIGGAADSNNDTLSIDSGRTVTSGTGGTITFIASGTDTISGSGTLTMQNSNLDTDGTLSSIVRFDATSGNITMPARTYGGLVEVYSNATDAGKTITMGAGTHTLSGALNLLAANTQNVTLAGTTNDPTLNLTGDLDFTGAGAGSEIVTAPDTGSVTWTLSGNADFTGGTYTKGTETLVMNGTTKTLTSNSNSLNNFEVSAGSVTMSGTTTVAGNLTISGGTLTAPSSGALNIAGNWNNSGGTFTDNSSTVTFNGSSQQTAQGTMTGTSDFNNLTITNSSGSDPDSSPSVIFSAAATVSGTFTATTASTKIRFNAGSTYTFVNVTLNGQATTTRVAMRSSANGTQWTLTSTGTQSVSNTDVRDSTACAGDTIDASDGTNLDSTNNSCWNINSVTLSISDVAIGFGTLSTTAATWANGAATGSATDVAAHTISITSNARSGYALTYNGATLTSGSNTVSVATITDDADGTAGSEQFAINFDKTTGNASITAGYDNDDGPDWKFVASSTTTVVSESGSTATETIEARYLANIAATTEPGSYSTNITYILTATY